METGVGAPGRIGPSGVQSGPHMGCPACLLLGCFGMPVLDDLKRFGPEQAEVLSRSEARAYCARLTATHYENFSVVTWLTPRPLRPAFQSIYAFCRWSDDLGDEVGDPAARCELLGWWRGELRAMYAGQARHPVMIALAETVAEFAIPIDPFEALISAFEQDQTVTEYATYEQLLDYCTRSANPVGHLVLYLARCVQRRERPALRRDLHRACNWPTSGRTWPATWRSAGSTCRARTASGSAIAEDDLRALRFTPAFADLARVRGRAARALARSGPGAGAADARAPWRSTSTSSRAAAWRSSTGSRPRGTTS